MRSKEEDRLPGCVAVAYDQLSMLCMWFLVIRTCALWSGQVGRSTCRLVKSEALVTVKHSMEEFTGKLREAAL